MNARPGIVFDLQRASLHDGPGVRTTVFLKGCPLRCAWCHNPESQSPRPELGFDAARCIGCRACVDACAQGVHRFDEAGAHPIASHRCVASAECVAACTSGALRLYGSATTVDEVMAEVRKDRVYYARSGGGLTLSGGEPTMQLGFCLALLETARAEGIQTCVETAGTGTRAAYAAILPHTDLFLFDYKATHPRRHRALTGGSHARVVGNLRWLAGRGAAIRLRCPLLPGVNDDPAHLRAIARLAAELPAIQAVELLPWHDWGHVKYERLRRPVPRLDTHLPTEAKIAAWRGAILSAGCPVPVVTG